MLKRTAMILALVGVVSGAVYYMGAVKHGPEPQTFSLDSPQGQAIHRAMQMQMQQMQQARMQHNK